MWPAVDIPGQWVYVASACVFVLLSAGACWRGWRYDRARGRPRCYKCGYPVAPDDAQAVTEAVGRAPCQQKAKRPRGSTREPGGSPAHASRAGCSSNQPKGADAGKTEGGAGAWACPECGWVPRRVKDLTRTRRSRRWLAVSLLLLAGGTSCWYAIHVQFRRYKLQEPLTTAAVPTTWWLLVLPHSSGDEDIIVYHRAYPQRMIAGKTRAGLLDSTRSVQATFYGPYGRFGSASDQSSAMPAWQHRWATRVFAESMQDEHRPDSERADRVWFYASFSGVDTPAEEQRLLSLLTETDEDLLFAVLFECFLRSIHTDAVANAAARAVAEPAYSVRMQGAACELLAMCGEHAVPYVKAWIESNEPESAYNVEWWFFESEHCISYLGYDVVPYVLDCMDTLLTSSNAMHQDLGLTLLGDLDRLFWRRASRCYAMFLKLHTALGGLIDDPDPDLHEKARGLIISIPEQLLRHYGSTDPRVIEAWFWLLSLRDGECNRMAAEGLRSAARDTVNPYRSDYERARQLRLLILELDTDGLEEPVIESLEEALEILDRRIPDAESE